MLIDQLTFTDNFNCYKKGDSVSFLEQVTIVAGDNGAGKSSLIACIRQLFDTEWSFSDDHTARNTLDIKMPKDKVCEYVDIALDHLAHRPDICIDSKLQFSVAAASSGQGTLMQVAASLVKPNVDIFILDEPERGLSRSNEHLMAITLAKGIEQNPNSQFIINTHSEIIMRTLKTSVLNLPECSYISIDDYFEKQMKLAEQKLTSSVDYISEERARINKLVGIR